MTHHRIEVKAGTKEFLLFVDVSESQARFTVDPIVDRGPTGLPVIGETLLLGNVTHDGSMTFEGGDDVRIQVSRREDILNLAQLIPLVSAICLRLIPTALPAVLAEWETP